MTRKGRCRWGWLVLVASLSGCAAPAEGGQGQLPALTEAAVDEARRLVQPSNDQRVDALLAELERRGLPYSVERFPGIGAEDDPRAEGRNVVVTLGAGTPEVIVGAHVDASRLASGALSHGMVDDAAGVVVLLHVADALRSVPLERRVRIVFFDMEEIGLVGSGAFVQSLDPAEVAAMINVDIVGYGDTLLYGPQATSPDGSPAHRVQVACARRGMPCVGMPGMPPGDDRSFLPTGIPTVVARRGVRRGGPPPLAAPPRRPAGRAPRPDRAGGPAHHPHRTRHRRASRAGRDDAGVPGGDRRRAGSGRGAPVRHGLPEHRR